VSRTRRRKTDRVSVRDLETDGDDGIKRRRRGCVIYSVSDRALQGVVKSVPDGQAAFDTAVVGSKPELTATFGSQ